MEVVDPCAPTGRREGFSHILDPIPYLCIKSLYNLKEDPLCIRTDFIPQPDSSYQNLPCNLINGNGLPFSTLGYLQMEETSREIDVFPLEIEQFPLPTPCIQGQFNKVP